MSNKFEALKLHMENNSDSGSGEDEINNIVMDLGPVDYPPGEHRLQHAYCLWFSQRPSISARNAHVQGTLGYSQALRLVGQVGTVEQWWALYSHIKRLHDLPQYADLHLFKKGIQPMWEDPANQKGGKWVIRVKKGQANRAWENLCMAMLGEQFMAGNEICGVVVSVRFQEDLLSIWNRNASDQMTTHRIRDALKRLLNLSVTTTMEYKTHNDSLKSWKTVPNSLKS
ncbi:PREDICTED: eukaryotic translation initiation factor 4E type 2 isoform X2 [Nicrophorus vespilloides]|uniref:eIF-4F 25 kDa subunit n=1 Tax=Nicrophorus vespilloides TaxID=110193 RepID=A0ABM1N3X8_NICVS|nr:PREDICTED: eukaryotic translation initiation factor 4E type 2 isoform X2 [Nicrophorus vespilloides]